MGTSGRQLLPTLPRKKVRKGEKKYLLFWRVTCHAHTFCLARVQLRVCWPYVHLIQLKNCINFMTFFFFLSPWLATYLAMKCSEYCSFARNFYSSWFSSYTVRWERGVVLRQCGVQYCHNIRHLKQNAMQMEFHNVCEF